MLDFLTRMLGRSRHDFAFHTWSTMLLVMAAVIGVEHLLVFWMIRTDQPRHLILGARFIQICAPGRAVPVAPRQELLPTTAAERELWSIWIGYFAANGVAIFVTRDAGSARRARSRNERPRAHRGDAALSLYRA